MKETRQGFYFLGWTYPPLHILKASFLFCPVCSCIYLSMYSEHLTAFYKWNCSLSIFCQQQILCQGWFIQNEWEYESSMPRTPSFISLLRLWCLRYISNAVNGPGLIISVTPASCKLGFWLVLSQGQSFSLGEQTFCLRFHFPKFIV